MSNSDNETFGWNDPIENPDEGGNNFRTVAPGVYDFEVKSLKRGQFNGSEKIPACDMAIVTISIADDDGEVDIVCNIFFVKKIKWKIAQLFRSVGLRKHGESDSWVPPWGKLVGRGGKCKIKNRKSTKSDNIFNEVEAFLDPVESSTPKAQQAQAAPPPNTEEDELPF